MGKPVFLADNVFSDRIYGTQITVSAQEDNPEYPVSRIVNGRRSPNDYYTPLTANVDRYVQSDSLRARAVNCLVVDESNLKGEAVQLTISSDSQTTQDTAVDVTIPTLATMGMSLESSIGAVTEDNRTWAIMFPLRIGTSFRFNASAMGAGLFPTIGNLWLGLAHDVPRAFDLPSSEDMDRLNALRTASEAGWLGMGNATPQRLGQFEIRIEDMWRYDIHRLHYRSLYGVGVPSWVWFDRDQAERGMCVVRPDAQYGFGYEPRWKLRRRATIPYEEHAPMVL